MTKKKKAIVTKLKKVTKKKTSSVKVSDLGIPTDYDLRKEGITQSLMQNFFSCRQRFIFSLNRWTHINMNITTGFGNMGHYVLDEMYNNFMHDGVILSDKDISIILDNYVDNKKHKIFGVPEQEIEISKAKVFALLHCYREQYKKDFTLNRFMEVESVFEVEYFDTGIILRGKKDGKFKLSRKPWNIEHKFSGRIQEDRLLLRLAIDFQNQFYLLADYLKSGFYPTGTIHNIIRKSGHKLLAGESPSDFEERYIELIEKDSNYFFMRFEIPYTEKDHKDFITEMDLKLSEVDDFLNSSNPKIFKCQGCCDAPFPCHFLQACASGKLDKSQGYFQNEVLFNELQD